MADKPVAAAVRNPQQGQGVIKRFFELLMMLVSMFLVIFAWGEVGKPSWIEYFNPPPDAPVVDVAGKQGKGGGGKLERGTETGTL